MQITGVWEKIKALPARIPAFRKDLVAVDLGTYAIKVISLSGLPSAPQLLHWGYIPLQELNELPPEEKRLATISALKTFLIQQPLPTREVAASISGNTVIVRYVRFPKLSKQDLAASISFEAEPYIPFDIKEVNLGFHILEEVQEEGQKKMETVLVAAKKEAIQSKLDILTEAGLRPVVMDVDAFALENLHEISHASQPETLLYLNIGHNVTNLAILENGASKVVRDIFIAGTTLTKAIQRQMQCDLATAEKLKKTHGLVTPEEKEKLLAEDNREVLMTSQALQAVLRDLTVEVHRSVDFYLSQAPDRSISRILLTGGSANLRNIDTVLSAELKVPVQILDPIALFQSGDPNLPKEIRISMAVASGLAMRKKGDWK